MIAGVCKGTLLRTHCETERTAYPLRLLLFPVFYHSIRSLGCLLSASQPAMKPQDSCKAIGTADWIPSVIKMLESGKTCLAAIAYALTVVVVVVRLPNETPVDPAYRPQPFPIVRPASKASRHANAHRAADADMEHNQPGNSDAETVSNLCANAVYHTAIPLAQLNL